MDFLENFVLAVIISVVMLIFQRCYERCKSCMSNFKHYLKKSDLKKIARFKEVRFTDVALSEENMFYLEGAGEPDIYGSYIILESKDRYKERTLGCIRFQNTHSMYVNKLGSECWKITGTFTVTKMDKKGNQLLLTAK